ncbi:MAG: hypothetical protein CSA39_04220 [Flavobacteriales bacterium]|nr:MAG: hypothetical protein CSA39_04220 [Flavobacteriales bacterium]
MITVKTESTKDPKVLKFVSSEMLTQGSFEYNNIDDAANSVLVQQLFHLPFVKSVLVTANFIAVERYNIVEWPEVQEELRQVIENYLQQHGSVFETKKNQKAMPVQIYAESTPNPAVMKFVTNRLLSAQNIEIKTATDAKGVPIAQALLQLPFVKEVFISENYVSIAKTTNIEWFEVTHELRDFLKEYLTAGNKIVDDNYIPKPSEKTEVTPIDTSNLDDISKEIIAILDEYIKPAVTSDGGNILFQSYNAKDKSVSVILQGACSGCPSSVITLKNGIEATLKQLLPNKIEEVVAING